MAHGCNALTLVRRRSVVFVSFAHPLRRPMRLVLAISILVTAAATSVADGQQSPTTSTDPHMARARRVLQHHAPDRWAQRPAVGHSRNEGRAARRRGLRPSQRPRGTPTSRDSGSRRAVLVDLHPGRDSRLGVRAGAAGAVRHCSADRRQVSGAVRVGAHGGRDPPRSGARQDRIAARARGRARSRTRWARCASTTTLARAT